MAVNDLITFRKGTASAWTSANPVLASGEPGYDLTNGILKIGNGVSNWTTLSGIGSTSVGGGSSSFAGVRGIINTTGTLTSFAVSGGYPVGYLDLFQDGIKLVSGLDFSATDGSVVSLSNSVPSGTVLEYLTISSEASVGGGSSGFSWSTVPISSTSSGVAGDIAYDSDYFYVATSTNLWKRAALSTWIMPSPTPTITSSPTNTPTITTTPTLTSTVTPTPSSVFDTTLVIASGSNSASANGVTLTGASGSSMRFNQTSPINNPLAVTDIRIYISGAYTYRITAYTEVITANKSFVLVTNTGTSYISSFGAGTDFGSYRRIDL